jgi:signal transduction histidine kinase
MFRLRRQLKALQEAHDELERQVQECTAALVRANDRHREEIAEYKRAEVELQRTKEAAETAARSQSAFLAGMGHDLRTPLHGVLSFAGFGIRKTTTATPEKLREYFQHIDQSGRTLLTLLDALLDLAKLESGRMPFEFEAVEMHEILATVAEELSSLLSKKYLTLRYIAPDFDTVVTLDRSKIMQMVRNLLSNVLKFAPEHGTIDLNVRQGETSIVVAIRAQSVGLPAGELEAVFDPFAPSSRTKTVSGETKLGIALCREIITAHQGRLWTERSPEGGTLFSFELPRQRQDEAGGIPDVVVGGGHVEARDERQEPELTECPLVA